MDDYEPTNSPELPYVTQVDWKSQDAAAVIVDDLDSGFEVVTDDALEESSMPGWVAFMMALPDPGI